MPPTEHFDVQSGGMLSDEFLRYTVLPLLKEKPKRWNEIINSAQKYVSQGQDSVGREPPSKRRRRQITTSSSPVRDEEEDL